jgi:hypothetical protein
MTSYDATDRRADVLPLFAEDFLGLGHRVGYVYPPRDE